MLIQSMRSKLPYISVSELLQEIIEETGYVRELEAENTEEAQQRMENIDELISKAVTYEESEEEPTLSGFLEEVALVADIDSVDETQDYVVLMTLHSAKGLEFPQVYLAGMEDGLFPGFGAICAEIQQRKSKKNVVLPMWESQEPRSGCPYPAQECV